MELFASLYLLLDVIKLIFIKKKKRRTALKILKKIKEDVEKVKKITCKKNGNIDKETQNLKINQKAILELKSTVTKMKN